MNDIIDSIERIYEYSNKKTYKEFEKDYLLQDAILRRLEVIGEASSRLSKEFLEKHANIPWAKIKGLRNVIIREYDEVDLKDLWNVVKKDLPKLDRDIRKIRLGS